MQSLGAGAHAENMEKCCLLVCAPGLSFLFFLSVFKKTGRKDSGTEACVAKNGDTRDPVKGLGVEVRLSLLGGEKVLSTDHRHKCLLPG